MNRLSHFLIVATTMVACTAPSDDDRPRVSVSVPAMQYFVNRLAGEAIAVNVLIPSAVGHSTYTPRPAQMMALSQSESYLAFGCLDFETTWRSRMQDAAPDMKWKDMSLNVNMIKGETCSAHSAEHHHAADPHYWLSPRQAKVLAQNVAAELKSILPSHTASIDSALAIFGAEIAQKDSALMGVAKSAENKAFMIYHPALSYLERDYGFVQLEVEREGSEPTPQGYIEEIEKARLAGARVVFVQQGYDVQKARQAAESIGAEVVEFSPEGENWLQTIDVIIEALNR